MTDEQFKALCNTYGFAPSRALRELIDCAVARQEILEEVTAQRDALLEACQTLVNLPEDWIATLRLLRVAVEQARAAIKAVEEGK